MTMPCQSPLALAFQERISLLVSYVPLKPLQRAGRKFSVAAMPVLGYLAVNTSVVQKLDLGIGAGTELRLDILNIRDAVYQIRNSTGVGVGAPQFGIRRTI